MKKFTKGFTLIELLIVIALLGALAVGLLAALDPFEQLKKGTDTGVRNTVAELHGSAIRYYAIKNTMPWGFANISGTAYARSADIASIVDTGELKSDFSTLAGDGTLSQIIMVGTDQSLTVCFQPKSKSFRSDNNTKYNSSGVEAAGCPSGSSTSCYWCVK
jgi:prepilin-type N-terminal cleavage/methylation domain-containing protein